MATIRKTPKEKNAWSDAFCTPEWLAQLLGYFDFDPCSNDRSHIRAGWAFSLEKGIDGLKMPWRGSGFMNWPYSSPMPWAQKAIHEMTIGNCTELVVLCKLDPSTEWWHTITENVLGVLDRWDFDDRIQFDEHPASIAWRKAQRDAAIERGDEKIPPLKTSNNFASVILHHRREDAPMLALADYATLWRKALCGVA
jgi:hypothetical protein